MTAMSEKRPASTSRITPADQVGQARRVPIGDLVVGKDKQPQRERRLDAQGREAFERGLQTGIARGRKEGFEAARSQLEQEQRETAIAAGGFAAQRLEAVIKAFTQDMQAMEVALADQVVDLAITVAHQVLMTELQSRPEHVAAVVSECLATLPAEAAGIRVRLNPGDLKWIEEAIETNQLARIDQLVADPSIDAGGCVVEHDSGHVDATLATRWQRTLASLGREATIRDERED